MNNRYPWIHGLRRTKPQSVLAKRKRVRRRLRAEMLESRRLLAADPTSWIVNTGSDTGADIEVTDVGDVFVGFTNQIQGSDAEIVLKKYSSAGVEQWTKMFPSPNSGSGLLLGIAVDQSDPLNPAVYVSGQFRDQLDFGTAGTLQSNGDFDAYVAKLDASGNAIWARRFGGSGTDRGKGLALQGSSVYLTGVFERSVDFSVTTLSANQTDGFVVKLDANGDVQWAEQIGGSGGVNAEDIAVVEALGGNANVYITGRISGSNNFGGTALNGDGGMFYLAKLNDTGVDGSFVWAEQYGGTGGYFYGPRVTTDGVGGVYVAGDFSGTAQFGSDSRSADGNDGFVMGATDQGSTSQIDWVNTITGPGLQIATDIAFDAGVLFVTSGNEFTSQFHSTDGTSLSVISQGDFDASLSRYDSDGKLSLVQSMGGSDSDAALNIAADNGIAYLTAESLSPNAAFPASPPDATFQNAYSHQPAAGEILVLKLNADAPIVAATPTLSGTEGTPVTLIATAIAGDLTTDLSQLIFWTDQTGATLGTGSSVNVSLGVGTHEITASVTDPVSGLIGIGGTVVTVVDPNQPVVLFSDSFENGQWNGLWIEDSQNDWFTSTQRSTDGNSSAEVDGRATDATLSIAAPIDMTAYGSAELSFDWYIEGGIDAGEGLKLEFFDGSTWNQILSLDGNVDQENAWRGELVQLDSQYLISDFRFRYSATMNKSNEDANVDNVQLIATPTGPPNQQPSITSTAVVNAAQDVAYAYDVDADDPDAGDTLTYSLDGAPSGMSIDAGSGVIDWVPGSSQVGDNNVTVRVQDQRGGSDTQSFVIDVANVNDPPSISSSPVTTAAEGVAYSYDVNASDPDPGDTLTYSLDVTPAGMTIDANTGVIDWTPDSGDVGAANTVTVRVTDLLGEFDAQSFSVDVSAPSDDAIYVYDIRFDSKRGNKDWRAVFEIRSDSNGNGAGDAGDNPIAGVQVEVTFAGNTYTGTTDSNGIFRTSWIKNLSSGNHYANAVDLALAGYQWNALDLDLEDDSDEIFGPDALLTR